MDGRVTRCASLILLGLIVERRSSGRCCVNRERVAFQAKQVDLAALQQTRIVGSVGRVASHAAFDLDRRVLPGEWTRLVRMAAKTNLIL